MEQSSGGTSKQQVNGNGDQKFPSSSSKIELNDDVLIQILLRLPVISLVLFKSVSKRWLALITDPNFTLLRVQKPNVDQPSGFFLLRYTPEFAYVPLDPRIPVNGSPKLTTFRFDQNSVNEIVVLQSCNGLILCCNRPDKYYVYNPTLDVFKLLPLPPVWEPIRMIRDMAIAYDPIISPYYKVLYPHNEYTSPNMPILIEIYSSKTGSWSIIRPLSLEMDVYEMKSDYSEWSVIYHVNLDHIRTKFSGRIIRHLPKRRFVMVRAILMGDEEDDPYFVLEVPGKLIRYNIVTNIYNELCEFIRPRASHDCCFMFIASLASV